MQLTLTLPDTLAESLRKQAAEQGCTLEELVAGMLRQQQFVRETRKLRLQLKEQFEKAGIISDEDIFKQVS